MLSRRPFHRAPKRYVRPGRMSSAWLLSKLTPMEKKSAGEV